jgi:arylsulfatase A-like enzyme
LVGVSLAFGLTVLTMAYAIGHISGCHLNPAVSIGLCVGGRFSKSELLPYIVAQVIGAVVGSTVLWVIASGQANFSAANGFAANGFAEHSPGQYSLLACCVAEVVLTFFFLMIILGATDKNHLGDKDEFLPTNHGFDEFFGNLYHLNAEEEPENEDYPQNPEFKKKFGPRGVIKATAGGAIEDTGPLTKKRMETIDEEVLAAATDFLTRAKQADKPFFCWFNTTRMHNFTHVKKENQGKTGLGFYADGMAEHDALVGKLLDTVDKLGLTENTIVVYTTDNGPMVCLYPDSGTTPFRGEKNTNWEGGWRVPALIRWPGVVKPGAVLTDIVAGEDWMPTLLAAAGEPNIKDKLLKGHEVGNMTYKVHLDGYDQTAYLEGKGPGARKEFFYFSDDGDLLAVRYGRIKVHFMVQEAKGIDVWRKPFTTLRAPIFFDLAVDPFERGDEGMNYNDWWYRRAYIAVPIQTIVGKTLMSFKEFPPRQRPASFTIDQAMERLMQATPGSK